MGLSDYSMVYVICQFVILFKNIYKYVIICFFKNFNVNVFREDLKLVFWDSLRNCIIFDEMIVIWENMFLKIVDVYVFIRMW